MSNQRMFPLGCEFYLQDTVELAKRILNCLLISESPEGTTIGRISETEAYTANDPACHAFRGKTARNQAMFGTPGHSYIYFTYGMHHCFNVVSASEGVGEAVLVRSIEPLLGLELMRKRRGLSKEIDFKSDNCQNNEAGRQKLGVALCGGPGKLCQAFGLDLSQNGLDLTQQGRLWIGCPNEEMQNVEHVIATPRIGISVETERLERFYLKGERFLSRNK